MDFKYFSARDTHSTSRTGKIVTTNSVFCSPVLPFLSYTFIIPKAQNKTSSWLYESIQSCNPYQLVKRTTTHSLHCNYSTVTCQARNVNNTHPRYSSSPISKTSTSKTRLPYCTNEIFLPMYACSVPHTDPIICSYNLTHTPRTG